jgi:hypothetical protein
VADKAFGMSGVGGLKYARTLDLDAVGVTEMDRGRGMETQSRMTVLVVVPLEEAPAEGTTILDRAKTRRELWPVLEGLELRL